MSMSIFARRAYSPGLVPRAFVLSASNQETSAAGLGQARHKFNPVFQAVYRTYTRSGETLMVSFNPSRYFMSSSEISKPTS